MLPNIPVSTFTEKNQLTVKKKIQVNTLPNVKHLNLSKFIAFADDKLTVNKKKKFGLKRVENIVGKGENAGFQHFLLFQQCFQRLISQVV